MILETFPVGPLACNCTLLGDEEAGEAIVIDPGDEVSRIHRRLTELGLKLKQILITHAHIDHVGGALKLKRLTGAPIFLNENDLPLLEMMDDQAAWLGVARPKPRRPTTAWPTASSSASTAIPPRCCTRPATPRARSACTLPRSSCSSPATRSLPAASAAPTCPAATSDQIIDSIHSRLLALARRNQGPARPRSRNHHRRRTRSNPFLRSDVNCNHDYLHNPIYLSVSLY